VVGAGAKDAAAGALQNRLVTRLEQNHPENHESAPSVFSPMRLARLSRIFGGRVTPGRTGQETCEVPWWRFTESGCTCASPMSRLPETW
jgi:hypothetical protein